MKRFSSLLWLLCLTLIATTLPLAACRRSQNTEADLPARFGPKGAEWAETLAERFPNRYAGSEEERGAAAWLKEQIEAMGYQVQMQSFQLSSGETSQNVVVDIPGTGFRPLPQSEQMNPGQPDWTPPAEGERRLLILAHYDTPKADPPTLQGYSPNGIHDNAAAVGALLTVLSRLAGQRPAYHLSFVFTGAASSGFSGAEAYKNSLGEDQLALVDACYNLDSIYAGDKVYAHAGRNSAVGNGQKSYRLRRKLYEATDVYYDNLLLTHNGFALYTNQSLIHGDLLKDGRDLIYREWTLHESDHLPFDRAGVPIVFFESYDYDADRLEDLTKESRDPQFEAVGGMIRKSPLDQTGFLQQVFQKQQLNEAGMSSTRMMASQSGETQVQEGDRYLFTVSRLEKRVNHLAFLLLQAFKKGPVNSEAR